MRSYIKIYGPPVAKAIRALDKIVFDMPQVCIMNTVIAYDVPQNEDETEKYFQWSQPEGAAIFEDTENCDKLISKTVDALGEYDFFFEWFKDPTKEELYNLIEKIDETLEPLGCKYTVITK